MFMIGKLPTLSSSRALVSSIFLYFDATKFSQKLGKSEGFEYDESPETKSPQKYDNKEVNSNQFIFIKILQLLAFYTIFECCFNRDR